MWIVFAIAAIVALIDQISKMLIEYTYITGETKYIIDKFFYITKTYNTGAGWSMLSDSTWLLCIFSLVASVALILVTYNTVKDFKKSKFYSISIAFILGGCVGNLVDRFLTCISKRDGVIDFIGVKFGNYQYPIFNLADSFLVVGVIMLLIDIIFFMDKRKGKK